MEVNIIRHDRTVDNFYIPANSNKFNYDNKEYIIESESILIVPLKSGLIMPSCFFIQQKETTKKDKNKNKFKLPLKFLNLNKGITGKAMSLLYKEKLYLQLFYPEVGKYNFFVVILSIATLIVFAIGMYFLYSWYTNGGVVI